MSRTIAFIVSIVAIVVIAVVLFPRATLHSLPRSLSQIQRASISQRTDNVPIFVFEQARVKLRIIEWWPVQILNIAKDENGSRKGDLSIEIKNVSGKQITSVEMLIHAPVCEPFAMTEGLWIGLGENNPYFTRPTEPTLDLGKSALINVPRERLDVVFSPTAYKECPPEQNYLFIELSKIEYADGTDWEGSHDADDPNWKK